MQSLNFSLSKSKYNFVIFSLKKAIIPSIFLLFTLSLIIFSKNNFIAAKDGLLLWANNVVPSLLPFFIATELLSYTNIVSYIGKLLNPIMKPLFNIPGVGSYALLMGIISGYPTGAKIVVNLKENNLCTKEEAERMIAFTNNSGPLFILGTVGISLFGNSAIGFLLLFTHILACLTVGILFRFYKYHNNPTICSTVSSHSKSYVDFSNLGEVLGSSIFSAIKTVVMIGGFIVLFSVILSILKTSKIIYMLASILAPLLKIWGVNDFSFSSSIVCGILELTNGIMQVAFIPCKYISTNIIIASFLLGFGGFSVMLQVYSIISKSGISIKPYILGKLLHAIIACFYTFLLINYIPIFNLNL